MPDQIVYLSEDYKIFDRLAYNLKQGMRGPLGWVQIFLQTKNGLIYDEGWNLVVSQGREFVAQRIFNSCVYFGGSSVDWRSYVLSHFAVGSGGSTINDDIFTPNGPFICDTGLITPISLGIASYLTEPDSGILTAVKPIVDPLSSPPGTAYLELVSYGNGECSNYTKMKCTCVIPSGEPTSLDWGESIKIDEAGLYFVSGSNANLFSHICFAPKWKEKEGVLTIQWYILF